MEYAMKWNPYLTFDGTCEEAFKFYEKTLGGKIISIMPFGDTPACGHVPPVFRNKIMHARLDLGDFSLMGSDGLPDHPYEGIKGASVALQIDNTAEAERVFKALSAKGTVQMPLEETFWAARFGMFVDQFGVPWMVNCEKPR
jgi:PhnB protein